MAGPMEGIKVVEMGVWVAGPSCAAILCDWGADVVKIEPPNGDPFRGLFASALGAAVPINPPFEIDNRGKKSICLNLENGDGVGARASSCSTSADVFVTNMRPRVLEQFGIGYDDVRKTNPRIVYAQLTGQGPDGPDSNRASYDIGGFWSRAGVGASLTAAGAADPAAARRHGRPHDRPGRRRRRSPRRCSSASARARASASRRRSCAPAST